MATGIHPPVDNEVSILARIFDNGDVQLPRDVASYILNRQISDRDKNRMHELAVRNQDDALSPAENEELFGFAKAATLLSILKSKALRTLCVKLESGSFS